MAAEKTSAPEAWIARNLVDVVPGIRRLRMPMDVSIDHINVYLIRDGSGWCVFDTGIDSVAVRNIWSAALSGPLKDGITRIIVSHHHPDHLGQAAWLQETTGAPVYIRPEELAAARAVALADSAVERTAREYFRGNGMPPADVDATVGFMRGFFACAIPHGTRTPEHGQRMTIGRYVFEVLVTGGHSVAQVALYGPSGGILISGDQMLERMTPNIGLWSFGDSAPLANFLKSLEEISSHDIRLVLPAHHEVYETDGRLPEKQRAHHRKMLSTVRNRLTGRMTAFDLAEAVYGNYRDIESRVLALVETLSHLQLLQAEGSIVRRDGERVSLYESVAP